MPLADQIAWKAMNHSGQMVPDLVVLALLYDAASLGLGLSERGRQTSRRVCYFLETLPKGPPWEQSPTRMGRVSGYESREASRRNRPATPAAHEDPLTIPLPASALQWEDAFAAWIRTISKPDTLSCERLSEGLRNARVSGVSTRRQHGECTHLNTDKNVLVRHAHRQQHGCCHWNGGVHLSLICPSD